MTANAKQIEAVLKLPAPKRYSHFIKKVVGWGKMWGLYSDGWAMSEAPNGAPVLPLWPEREYAERCINGEWLTYEPRAIELEEVFNRMTPMLRERGILPGVFFSPEIGSIDCTLDQLEADLRAEMDKYREPNHIDVNRLRDYNGELNKKKLPYKG